MDIPINKKIYFSSDNHLGAPSLEESHAREKIFVSWLDSIKDDADIIFLSYFGTFISLTLWLEKNDA